MLKRVVKRFIVMHCVTVMFITSPELTLLADEMHDSSAYTNTQDEWESGKMQEEQPVSERAESIDETRKVEEQDTGESDGIYIGEEDDILDLMDISGCTITLSATSYTYNGSAKKPVVTVKDGAATLVSLDSNDTVPSVVPERLLVNGSSIVVFETISLMYASFGAAFLIVNGMLFSPL